MRAQQATQEEITFVLDLDDVMTSAKSFAEVIRDIQEASKEPNKTIKIICGSDRKHIDTDHNNFNDKEGIDTGLKTKMYGCVIMQQLHNMFQGSKNVDVIPGFVAYSNSAQTTDQQKIVKARETEIQKYISKAAAAVADKWTPQNVEANAQQFLQESKTASEQLNKWLTTRKGDDPDTPLDQEIAAFDSQINHGPRNLVKDSKTTILFPVILNLLTTYNPNTPYKLKFYDDNPSLWESDLEKIVHLLPSNVTLELHALTVSPNKGLHDEIKDLEKRGFSIDPLKPGALLQMETRTFTGTNNAAMFNATALKVAITSAVTSTAVTSTNALSVLSLAQKADTTAQRVDALEEKINTTGRNKKWMGIRTTVRYNTILDNGFNWVISKFGRFGRKLAQGRLHDRMGDLKMLLEADNASDQNQQQNIASQAIYSLCITPWGSGIRASINNTGKWEPMKEIADNLSTIMSTNAANPWPVLIDKINEEKESYPSLEKSERVGELLEYCKIAQDNYSVKAIEQIGTKRLITKEMERYTSYQQQQLREVANATDREKFIAHNHVFNGINIDPKGSVLDLLAQRMQATSRGIGAEELNYEETQQKVAAFKASLERYPSIEESDFYKGAEIALEAAKVIARNKTTITARQQSITPTDVLTESKSAPTVDDAEIRKHDAQIRKLTNKALRFIPTREMVLRRMINDDGDIKQYLESGDTLGGQNEALTSYLNAIINKHLEDKGAMEQVAKENIDQIRGLLQPIFSALSQQIAAELTANGTGEPFFNAEAIPERPGADAVHQKLTLNGNHLKGTALKRLNSAAPQAQSDKKIHQCIMNILDDADCNLTNEIRSALALIKIRCTLSLGFTADGGELTDLAEMVGIKSTQTEEQTSLQKNRILILRALAAQFNAAADIADTEFKETYDLDEATDSVTNATKSALLMTGHFLHGIIGAFTTEQMEILSDVPEEIQQQVEEITKIFMQATAKEAVQTEKAAAPQKAAAAATWLQARWRGRIARRPALVDDTTQAEVVEARAASKQDRKKAQPRAVTTEEGKWQSAITAGTTVENKFSELQADISSHRLYKSPAQTAACMTTLNLSLNTKIPREAAVEAARRLCSLPWGKESDIEKRQCMEGLLKSYWDEDGSRSDPWGKLSDAIGDELKKPNSPLTGSQRVVELQRFCKIAKIDLAAKQAHTMQSIGQEIKTYDKDKIRELLEERPTLTAYDIIESALLDGNSDKKRSEIQELYKQQLIEYPLKQTMMYKIIAEDLGMARLEQLTEADGATAAVAEPATQTGAEPVPEAPEEERVMLATVDLSDDYDAEGIKIFQLDQEGNEGIMHKFDSAFIAKVNDEWRKPNETQEKALTRGHKPISETTDYNEMIEVLNEVLGTNADPSTRTGLDISTQKATIMSLAEIIQKQMQTQRPPLPPAQSSSLPPGIGTQGFLSQIKPAQPGEARHTQPLPPHRK